MFIFLSVFQAVFFQVSVVCFFTEEGCARESGQ